MYWIIRLIIIAVLAVCALFRLKKTKTAFTKKRKVLIVIVAIILCAIIEFLPIEHWFFNFSTPEAAFSYMYSEGTAEIIDGDESSLVLGKDSMIVTLSKTEKGWKCPSFGGTDSFLKGYSEPYYIEVMRHKKTNDYYVCVMTFDGKEFEITDSRSTDFVKVKRNDNPPEYYGYVRDLDDNYYIVVDGEKIEFSSLK